MHRDQQIGSIGYTARILMDIKLMQSTADTCRFVLKQSENTIYIIVYVEDILIAESDEQN